MSRIKILALLKAKIPARKSLSGNLQLLTSAVFTVIIVAFVTAYSFFSYRFSNAERIESANMFGTTLASLVARPVSLGDYASVEQALHQSAIQGFLCEISVLNSSGMTVAGSKNSHSKICKDPRTIQKSFPITSAESLDLSGPHQIGTVVLSIGTSDLWPSTLRSILVSLVLGAAVLWLLLLFNRIAVDWALAPLWRAVSTAAKGSDQSSEALKAAPTEIRPLIQSLVNLHQENAKAEGDIRVANVSRQVAHDIRSPLAALQMIAATSGKMPEEDRRMLRQASLRITDIANDLSGKSREINSKQPKDKTTPELLPVLIDEIVTEMRLRFRPRLNLSIAANTDLTNYGLFSLVDASLFKRVMSNLIQNSAEAIKDAGEIQVFSWIEGDRAVIEVIDTGNGIKSENITELFQRGASFDKPEGSGLGLHQAKEAIEGWQGLVEIHSEVGQGTTVKMTLPLAQAPAWFVPKIELREDARLIILDDDQSIHQIWDERFSSGPNKDAIRPVHFSSARRLRIWFDSNPEAARQANFLVDFELIGEEETGLSLIKDLGIEKTAILVTSRYDEPEVKTECEARGIRIIPKGMAAFVPISIAAQRLDAVVIDDEDFQREIWNHVGLKTGRRFLTYATEGEVDHTVIPNNTPIYVDWNLGELGSGGGVLKRLRDRGYNCLYVFSGDDSMIGSDEYGFVRGVVKKEIPKEFYTPV